MAYYAVVTQAPHASRHNGVEASDARQYFARRSQRVMPGPRIAAAVASLSPGDFTTIWADNANQIFKVYIPADASGTEDILDWTPHGVWDADTEQVLIGGRRGLTKIIGYSDVTGDWRELPMPADLGRLVSATVHYYGRIARNPMTGVVYFGSSESNGKLWSYLPTTETWTRLADHPTANGGNGASFEWMADTERLVCYAGDAQRWMVYTPGTNSWVTAANSIGHGAHNLLRYHPTHGRSLLLGGTGTTQRASLMTSAGVATQVTDIPQGLGYSTGAWCHAHSSGCWIVKAMGTTPTIYAVWPNEALDDVTWVDLGTAPDSALTYPTLIPGYSSDTVLIVSTSGLHAWRVPVLDEPGTTTLTVQDATHGHTADNITLSTGTTLTVQDAVHAHTADNVVLDATNATVLTVQDALHAHSADEVALSTGTSLVVADALHAHAADAVGLTTDATLAVADALHGHAADNITIEPLSGTTLTVQDATHGHTADGVALTLDLTLAVQDATHGHVADEVALDLGYVTLVVQDALHAHTADSVTLWGDVEPPPLPPPTLPGGGGGQTLRRRRPTKQEIEWQEDEAFQDVLALLNRSKNQQEAEMAEVLEVIMALAAAGVLD